MLFPNGFNKKKRNSDLIHSPGKEEKPALPVGNEFREISRKLGLLDKLLSPLIVLCMIVGVVTGEFVPDIQRKFGVVDFHGVSVPIAIGLIIMMWPTLTKIQYEKLFVTLSTSRLWIQLGISLVLNWIVGPLIMLGLAWATLPDLPTYRTGVIMVGLARCIAMVTIWNQLAGGDAEYCAILVIVNSILQIALYSPYSLLFVNVIGNNSNQVHVEYSVVAISVLIYLGIPLVAGIITRYVVLFFWGKSTFENRFLRIFSPLALLGLLYTIFVIFAFQGHHIIHNLGKVFRVFVPLILYFVVMWTGVFFSFYYFSRKEGTTEIRVDTEKRDVDGTCNTRVFGYEMAVVQSFTAGSNNFELAIAVAVAVYGVGSDQALAASIGPLVEVPVLLALTWIALLFAKHFDKG